MSLCLMRQLFLFCIFFCTNSIPFVTQQTKAVSAHVCLNEELIKEIELAEDHYKLPKNLLKCIAYVESANRLWVLRIDHKIYRFNTKAEAVQYLEKFTYNHKMHNIDIGIMQVNNQHVKYFDSLTDMLEPKKNIWFAARLLAYNITIHKSILKGVLAYNVGASNAKKYYDMTHIYLRLFLQQWKKFYGYVCQMHIEDYVQYVTKIYRLQGYSAVNEFIFVKEQQIDMRANVSSLPFVAL